MFSINLTGLDKLNESLEQMKSPEFLEAAMTEKICEVVPEAENEKHNFRYTHNDGKINLVPESVTPELYSKIITGFGLNENEV